MAKTRIHDLAAEFGIESEQLIKLLADMDIHVRSHLSALDSGQVALVRARWEREKRRSKEPKKKTTRRRTASKTTSKRKKAAPDEKAPARPRRRRRTAAEVAQQEALKAEEDAREAAAEELAAANLEEAPATETAKPVAIFVDLPPETETRETQTEIEPEAPAEARDTGPEPEVSLAEPEDQDVAGRPEPDTKAPVQAEREPAQAPPPGRIPPKIPRPVKRQPPIKPVASGLPKPVASAAPGATPEERRRDKKKRKRGKKTQVDQEAVQANISRTLASIKGPGHRKTSRRRDDEPSFRELEEQRRQEEKEREKTLVRVKEYITVSELADLLKVSPTQIVTFCFKELGLMVTVNQRLDFDQIELIAGEFGYQAVQEEEYVGETEELEEEEDAEENLEPRPPVVTVMGHVDHGKTSLLDYIRKTNVIAGEAGGITQHIGAYHVELPGGKHITFLDTPGHEAFTAMRARGAQITDLVILVIAADDQVMPQTVEAISHARNAGVPLIVAINKIDLPSANVEKVKQDLLQHEVLLEDFGGDTLYSEISAKTGRGIEDLYEKILLQSELLDKKANPNRRARATVIESSLDPGKGPVATVLVQNGTLRVGDDFICGSLSGRVRAMFDERGNRIETAGPSIPAQVLGFDGVAVAGDHFTVVANAQEARDIAQKRQRLDREAQHRRTSRSISLEDFSRQVQEGEVQCLNIIIKADQGGPAEALADAFDQLSTPEARIEVVHRGVGAITEGDVLLAKASGAIIVGFHVRPDANAREAAEREKVDIHTYRVIYEAVEDVKSALEGMLRPEERETVLGEAEVRQVFKISGLGTIAGCYVRNGTIKRTARVRVVRDGVQVYDGNLSSLKRFKDDAREVKEGLECGIGVENFNDVKVGDILEAYQVEQIARTLEQAGAAREE